MARSLSLILSFLLAAPLVAAGPRVERLTAQDPPSRGAATNLTGTWTDERGRQVEIIQNDTQVTLRTQAGLAFTGTLEGNRLRLSYRFSSTERMPSKWRGLPEPVRELLNQRGILFEGTVEPDGRGMSGEFITPDRIDYDPETFALIELTDRRIPIFLTRVPDLTKIEIVNPDSLEPIDEIAIGESFRVQLTFAEDPGTEISRTVTIRTSDGSAQKVRVTGNSRVIVSKPILAVSAEAEYE